MLAPSFFSQSTDYINELNKIITHVKMKYSPDKRVAVFNITPGTVNDGIKLVGETDMPEAKNELIELIAEKKIAITDEIKLLPDEKLGDKIYGLVNLSVANIRSKPDHPAELATQALLGTPVKVLKYDDGFYLIQTPDKYISWVDGDGIYRITKSELDEWVSAKKILYLKEYGFAYSSMDINSQRVSDLVMGDLLLFVEDNGDFVKVGFPDEREAFVESSSCIQFDKWFEVVKPSDENILSTAHSLMGVPYLWGGTSSKGLDCSGFTKTIYFMNGIVLPRDASQQVHSGILVDTENGWGNLQRGDLLFFGRKASDDKPERVTHVAIYIGNMEYIHASGRVKINSLDPTKENFSEYRLKSFIRAKRILSSIDKNGVELIRSNKFYNGEF